MKNIIFICIHNSARSQMAEEYMRKYHGDKFNCYSAGIEQGKLNPIVVEAMRLDGIDISNNKAENVDIYINSGIDFDYIITVCDETNAEKCPIFPGNGKRIHMGFEDPSALNGSCVQNLLSTVLIRKEIEKKIKNLEL